MQVYDFLGDNCIVGLSNLKLDMVEFVNVVSTAVTVDSLVCQHETTILIGFINNWHTVLGELRLLLKFEIIIYSSVENLNMVS